VVRPIWPYQPVRMLRFGQMHLQMRILRAGIATTMSRHSYSTHMSSITPQQDSSSKPYPIQLNALPNCLAQEKFQFRESSCECKISSKVKLTRNLPCRRVIEIHNFAPCLSWALQDAFHGFPLDVLRPMLQSPDFKNVLLPLRRSAIGERVCDEQG
jgi:hypothetical protein